MRTVALVFGAAFTLFVPIGVGLLTSSAALASISAICGAFVVLLVKLDDLVELSLGPVKAKMKETIQEAAATIEQLQDVAVVSAKAQLTQLGRSLFGWDVNNRIQLVRVKNEIVETLKRLNIPDIKIREAEEDWRHSVTIVYHRFVRDYLKDVRTRGGLQMPAERLEPAHAEINDLLDANEWRAAMPHQLQAVLERHDVLTPALAEWLAEYRHFLATGEIRNPETWALR